jgi:hypothetical protein
MAPDPTLVSIQFSGGWYFVNPQFPFLGLKSFLGSGGGIVCGTVLSFKSQLPTPFGDFQYVHAKHHGSFKQAVQQSSDATFLMAPMPRSAPFVIVQVSLVLGMTDIFVNPALLHKL